MKKKNGNDDYYASYKEMRKFIDGLEAINEIGKDKKKHVPIQDIDAELINTLLTNWFDFFPDYYIDPVKRDFVIEVFKDMKQTVIYDEFAPYIQSMCEWLRLSARDPLNGNLAIFLLGWCWHK